MLEKSISLIKNHDLKEEFMVMFKNRELISQDLDIKQKILYDSIPKELIFGRKTKISADIILRFI